MGWQHLYAMGVSPSLGQHSRFHVAHRLALYCVEWEGSNLRAGKRATAAGLATAPFIPCDGLPKANHSHRRGYLIRALDAKEVDSPP